MNKISQKEHPFGVIVFFTKNFSKEYRDYIIQRIPNKYTTVINKDDNHLTFLFNKDTFGYIYGSKQDESLEQIRFNFTFVNKPMVFDIDDLNEFLVSVRL